MEPIDFGGQRSRSHLTCMEISCEPNQTKPNPIDFGGHSSKVKVAMGIIDKCGVRGDATLCVVIFSKIHLFHSVLQLFKALGLTAIISDFL